MLKLNQVTKIYRLGKVDVTALQDINMNVAAGDFLALAGPSGSGKTTILNILGCLDTPTNGEAILEGYNLSALSFREKTKLRREKIGFIFQSFNLIPVLNVYENVEYPLLLENIPAHERRKKIMAVLEEVGLKERAKHLPGELSGGERQRAGIARALVKKPSIILADEPTANLDSVSGNNIIDLLQKLNRDEKVTIIFSSHDLQILSKAHSLLNLRDGKIVAMKRNSKFEEQEISDDAVTNL